jgi:Flp pilus assembly protein CpaB
MRAVAIDVSDSSAVAGMLSPGSKVDVIGTLKMGDQQVTKQIIENVEVQSIQRQVSGYSTQNGVSTALETGPVKSVMLLVTPKQASAVELANASGGHLRLTLRGNGDSTSVDGTMSENELKGIVETTKPVEAPVADVFENTPPPEDKGRPVQLILGGKTTTVYMNDKTKEETANGTSDGSVNGATPPTKSNSAGKKTKPAEGEPQTASGKAEQSPARTEERSNLGQKPE